MAAIPCPIHCPKGWISFQEDHPKDDYHKSAAIAINCCAECSDCKFSLEINKVPLEQIGYDLSSFNLKHVQEIEPPIGSGFDCLRWTKLSIKDKLVFYEAEMSNWAKNFFKASSNGVVNSCEHENTRHHAPTDDRYCHDCKCIIEVAGKTVSPIPVAIYQAQRTKEFPSDMERIAQELDLPKDKSHIGHILLAIYNLKEKAEKQ